VPEDELCAQRTAALFRREQVPKRFNEKCIKTGGCDVGFMLIDPARATEVDFTPAFVRSDYTYLVPANSQIRSAADVDRPGVRIAAVRGHASTAALLRIVKQASPVYGDTFESAVDQLRTGNAEVFASIREVVLQYSTRLSGSRVLEDNYQSNLAGIAVPKGNAGRLGYIGDFLDDMKRSGSLQQLVDGAGLRGVEMVAPKGSN
jgi:polar amino acid transport system substrate-binding protein